MKNEYNELAKLCVIRNSISLVCFTILAIIFNKWWLIFFSALFLTFVEKEGK